MQASCYSCFTDEEKKAAHKPQWVLQTAIGSRYLQRLPAVSRATPARENNAVERGHTAGFVLLWLFLSFRGKDFINWKGTFDTFREDHRVCVIHALEAMGSPPAIGRTLLCGDISSIPDAERACNDGVVFVCFYTHNAIMSRNFTFRTTISKTTGLSTNITEKLKFSERTS